jgi:hypothetical protein
VGRTKETPEFEEFIMEQIPPDFRADEQYQAIEAFAERLLDKLEAEAKIDGLPHGRYGVEIEAPDVSVHFDREHTKRFICSNFIDTWRKMEEISKQ